VHGSSTVPIVINHDSTTWAISIYADIGERVGVGIKVTIDVLNREGTVNANIVQLADKSEPFLVGVNEVVRLALPQAVQLAHNQLTVTEDEDSVMKNR